MTALAFVLVDVGGVPTPATVARIEDGAALCVWREPRGFVVGHRPAADLLLRPHPLAGHR